MTAGVSSSDFGLTGFWAHGCPSTPHRPRPWAHPSCSALSEAPKIFMPKFPRLYVSENVFRHLSTFCFFCPYIFKTRGLTHMLPHFWRNLCVVSCEELQAARALGRGHFCIAESEDRVGCRDIRPPRPPPGAPAPAHTPAQEGEPPSERPQGPVLPSAAPALRPPPPHCTLTSCPFPPPAHMGGVGRRCPCLPEGRPRGRQDPGSRGSPRGLRSQTRSLQCHLLPWCRSLWKVPLFPPHCPLP